MLDIGSSEFRDPKVFWHGSDDGHWVMVAVEAVARRVVIYTSPDLISWTRASPFGPAHATDGVWECPDLFPLSVAGTKDTRWVLIVSMNPGGIAGGSGTQYFVGDFDGTAFTADRLIESDDPTTYDWLDYGRDYYAAVSFNDVPDGRRLMIGWASNWDYANETPTHPWRSAMSLAREVTLVPDEEGIPRIHERPVLPQDSSALTSFTVTVPCAPRRSAERFVLSAGSKEHPSAITVDGDHRSITSDRTRSGATETPPTFPSIDRAPLPGADTTEVELFVVVDATIVEIYVDGGRVTLTEQVFPSEPFTQLRVEGEARVGRA